MSRRVVMIVGLMIVGSAMVSVQAQGPAAPRKGYQVLRVFPERFTCEYPAKDWDIVSGGASALVAVTHKKHEATIVVEYQPMQIELAPSEIDENFAKLEVEPISARQIGVSQLSSKIQDINGHRAIVIEYSRKGAMGPEHVRQYSLPIGKSLYRVIGSAPTGNFDRYAPTFDVAAQSFVVVGAAPAAAPAAAPKR